MQQQGSIRDQCHGRDIFTSLLFSICVFQLVSSALERLDCVFVLSFVWLDYWLCSWHRCGGEVGGSAVTSCYVLAGSAVVCSSGYYLFVRIVFLLVRIVCFCVSYKRLRVVVVMDFLWWFGFINPKGLLGFFAIGWVGVLVCLTPWSFRSVEICRPQVFKVTSSPLWFWPLIHLSQCGCYRTVKFERAIIPAALFRGCWYVDLDTVLAVDPFVNYKPFFNSMDVHSSYFFVIWFRARTWACWVAFVRSDLSVRII